MNTFLLFVIYFAIYSFCGWLWELFYIRLTQHRWHLHGILRVPLLPIYGFSALAILIFVQPYISNPFLVFLTGALVVSVIEFCTGFFVDKVFHVRLWDYSKLPMNLDGYTDLYTSLGFGMLTLLLVYVLQPWFASGVDTLTPHQIKWIGWTIFIVVSIDFINAVSGMIHTRLEIMRKDGSLKEIQKRITTSIEKDKNSFSAWFSRLQHSNLKWMRNAFPNAESTRRSK